MLICIRQLTGCKKESALTWTRHPTLGPYFFLESSSGAAYAGLPHWVLKGSE